MVCSGFGCLSADGHEGGSALHLHIPGVSDFFDLRDFSVSEKFADLVTVKFSAVTS